MSGWVIKGQGGRASAAAVLRFWFDHPRQVDGDVAWWFAGAGSLRDGLDARIRRRFTGTYEAARDGRLVPWAADAAGARALVLLLDQFPRHLFRGASPAYATDDMAQAIARLALARGFDRGLDLWEATFVYLPFEHSEALADQDLCVRLFARFAADPRAKLCLAAGDRHREIIQRFGRFPHRNAVLGRSSTPEEIAFLREPNSAF